MSQKIKNEIYEFRLLMRSVPTLVVVFFVLSVFSMNLMANKSISLPFDWLALDCGITVSWVAFLIMDVITKHFGPKAANQISVLAILINLAMCFAFFIVSIIPGAWGESYAVGDGNIINSALNNTFGGTWYVLAGSTLAFLISAFVNNFTNMGIGKALEKAFGKKAGGFGVYAARTYISTAVGQFTDNLVFALFVSHLFFDWSILQCFTCALAGMTAELLCEIIFSFFGYKICRRWESDGVGKEYFNYISKYGADAT